jgi:hypothetical protein
MTITRAAIATLAATLALGAATPAAHAARNVAGHVSVGGDRTSADYRCGLSQIMINNELDDAQDAASSGHYDQVNAHLQAASGIAAAAQRGGCTVSWNTIR